MFFESIMREDRNVVDLLTADYTFLNERLAQSLRHSGRATASQFRRVTLTDDARQGLLGQGSILTRDLARRPHVARRARQVDPREPARHAAAAAAAGRPAARRRTRKAIKPLTMREQMEEHRANPVVRELPQGDGSDRVRARELRRRRRLAGARRAARRSTRRASSRTARPWTASSRFAHALLQAARRLRAAR